MMVRITRLFHALTIIAGLGCSAASAQDSIKLAIGQRGNWDTSVSEIGTRAGIFKKNGLALEMLYTQGSAETLQAVLSGSVDIGVGAGVMGVLGAYSKNAPVRILGAETTGAGDLFWYVKAEFADQDAQGHRRQDAGLFRQGLLDRRHRDRLHEAVSAQGHPHRARGPAAEPDRRDVGPGRRRLVGAAVRARSTRQEGNPHHRDRQRRGRVQGPDRAPLAVNAQALQSRKAVFERYMKAYRETIDYMYSDPAALKLYSEWLNIPEAKAKRTRDEFFPKTAIDPDKVIGLDTIVKDAVDLKYTASPLTQAQLSDLIQIPPR